MQRTIREALSEKYGEEGYAELRKAMDKPKPKRKRRKKKASPRPH